MTGLRAPGIVLRRMTGADIAAGMRLKAAAGWNQTEADWALFLRLSPDGCTVAADGDRVVGTVTTLRYPGRLAWISMLLVEPGYRGQGIGARLFDRALCAVREWGTVALDATPAGQSLYAARGLVVCHRIDRMVIPHVPSLSANPEDGIERVREGDWPAIAALDGRAFGADRSAVLRDLWRRAPGMSWRRVRAGQLVGVALGRHGARYEQVGPLVAETVEDAVALCRASLLGLRGRPAVLDVPAYQDALREWLRELGFVRERTLARMALVPWNVAPSPGAEQALQYAIGGPELG
ncbi:MAG: GNAT family N-acetyltransferase [Anaerolineae bacterium]|nr:GNAT family N-acetyltransferase [Anaerolineae bacterium]